MKTLSRPRSDGFLPERVRVLHSDWVENVEKLVESYSIQVLPLRIFLLDGATLRPFWKSIRA